MTSEKYDNITVEFYPHPTRYGYGFIGWATTDGAIVAEYYEDMDTPTIYMAKSYVLYPVFEYQGGKDPRITINNQTGDTVAITDRGEIVLHLVNNGSTETFTLNGGADYKIRIPSSSNSSLNGTYKGAVYNNEPLTSGTHEGYDWINEPTSGQKSTVWEPVVNDDFTITVSSK